MGLCGNLLNMLCIRYENQVKYFIYFRLKLTPRTKPAQDRVSTIITFNVAAYNEALFLKVLSYQSLYVTYKIM
jgi:hypothetical protein